MAAQGGAKPGTDIASVHPQPADPPTNRPPACPPTSTKVITISPMIALPGCMCDQNRGRSRAARRRQRWQQRYTGMIRQRHELQGTAGCPVDRCGRKQQMWQRLGQMLARSCLH